MPVDLPLAVRRPSVRPGSQPPLRHPQPGVAPPARRPRSGDLATHMRTLPPVRVDRGNDRRIFMADLPVRADRPGAVNPSSDRLKAIDSALLQIERQFGKGSIMRL